MRKLIIIIAIALFACKKEEVKPLTYSDLIVGSWRQDSVWLVTSDTTISVQSRDNGSQFIFTETHWKSIASNGTTSKDRPYWIVNDNEYHYNSMDNLYWSYIRTLDKDHMIMQMAISNYPHYFRYSRL